MRIKNKLVPQQYHDRKAGSLLEYYNTAFYEKRQAWKGDYEAISDWINKNIDGESFGDIGCGNGIMIAHLDKLGKKVWGVDAAENFERFVDKNIRKNVKNVDITKAHKLGQCDVVLCFETAERIDKKYADVLLDNIVSTSANTIVFTAAEPGEAGIYHVNLQPKKYWLDKFAKHGYCLDVAQTEKFRASLAKKIKGPVWYLSDIMILQKCDNERIAKAYAAAGKFIEGLVLEVEDLKAQNEKLKHDHWLTAQELHRILNSTRWKVSSRFVRIIKR